MRNGAVSGGASRLHLEARLGIVSYDFRSLN